MRHDHTPEQGRVIAMLTEKAIAMLRAIQVWLAATLSMITKRRESEARAFPLATVVDDPALGHERGSVFMPSSTYAQYVASVAYSDRRYPDVHYLSRS